MMMSNALVHEQQSLVQMNFAGQSSLEMTANVSPSSSKSTRTSLEEVNNNSDKSHFLGHDTTEDEDAASSTSTSSSSQKEEDVFAVYELSSGSRLTVTSTEEWLCVARLPMDFTRDEFEELTQEYGAVQQSILVHSETSGKFKGYGLVKYVSKASSIQARHVLDGQEVRGGHVVDCDWLKHTNPSNSVISLHSKCLYVDNLPEDYRDMSEFRRIFSRVVNPPYCQIAIKNGVIQKWGLVEFQSSQEAEQTLESLLGRTLQGKPFRVQYCIPGVHAINIYMNFVNNPMDAVNERKALLEETPSSKVYSQLNSLAKHNPWFVQSLQNIMASTAMADTKVQEKLDPVKTYSTNKGTPPAPPTADPAQAALILLLAGRVQKGPPEQTATLLQTIVKQMSTGMCATDILRNLIPSLSPSTCPPSNDLRQLIQTAMTLAGQPTTAVPDKQQQPPPPPPNDKCPQLMDLLYKSFQAKLAKEQQRNKAAKRPPHETIMKKRQQKPQTEIVYSSSQPMTTTTVLQNQPIMSTVTQPPPPQPHLTTQQAMAFSGAQFLPPHAYYTPTAALFAPPPTPQPPVWPWGQVGFLPQDAMANMLALQQNQMDVIMPQVGLKRAAPPLMYTSVDAKRMKLA